MSRIIEIVSNSEGVHYLLFGLDNDSLSSFKIQMWVTKFGARYVDWAQALGMGMISFVGGDLWLHNDDTVPRCNLYGEQKDCIVGIVTNEEPTKVKIFDSLGIHSDGEWEVYSVTIPKTLNYPVGMLSKIPIERFEKRDGVLRAEFMRNLKSTSDTEKIMDAINGDPLRGYSAYLLLKNVNNTSGEQVKLFKISINSTLSKI
jgi:hypothetical protein